MIRRNFKIRFWLCLAVAGIALLVPATAQATTNVVPNPGFEQGIRIGDALKGWVRYFILDQGGNPISRTGSGPEFGTVDKQGNIFAGEPRPRVLRKYVKVR